MFVVMVLVTVMSSCTLIDVSVTCVVESSTMKEPPGCERPRHGLVRMLSLIIVRLPICSRGLNLRLC